jgi:hypothetical protein
VDDSGRGGCVRRPAPWLPDAGALGPVVYVGTSGPQRLRIQIREDGVSIDQIVLSPSRDFTAAPGTLKNDKTLLTRTAGQ